MLLPPDPLRPGASLLPGGAAGLTLARGRVHEGCGPARRTLAAFLMGRAAATPVLWILPAWVPERPMPDGLLAWADPARLILVAARRPEDMLWAAEEALRSGAVPLVIADLLDAPALTPVRRLQLAAEAGAGAGAGAGAAPALPPLGLLLTPGEGGAAGTDSRWHLAQAPGGGWRLTRLRARRDPPASWTLRSTDEGITATPALADAPV
jgi:protein ImuA